MSVKKKQPVSKHFDTGYFSEIVQLFPLFTPEKSGMNYVCVG